MMMPVLMCIGFAYGSHDNNASDRFNHFMTTTHAPKGLIVGRGSKQGINANDSKVEYLRNIDSWGYVEPNCLYQESSKNNVIVGSWPISFSIDVVGTLDAFVFDFATTDNIAMGGDINKSDDAKRQVLAPAIAQAYQLLKVGGMLVIPCDIWRYTCSTEKAKNFLLSILPEADYQYNEWRSVDGQVITQQTWDSMIRVFGRPPSVAVGEIEPVFTENSPVLPDMLSDEQRASGEFNMGLSYRVWKWFEITKNK